MTRRTINPGLDKFITALLEKAKHVDTPLEDQLKIVDRALKLELLKAKLRNADMGAAFGEEQDDE
jgi:hypothetical protein